MSSAHLNDLAGTRDDASDRAAKLKSFCHTFAERAFRRPLTADENKSVVDRQFEVAKDPEIAVKRVVLRTLTSPEFLYREIGREPDGYKVASRLSYGLWDSMPDQELLRAAASGQLSTKEQIAKQAERMLADPRAKAKIHAVSADLDESRSAARSDERHRDVSGLRSGGDLRFADVVGIVSRRRGMVG